MFPLHHQPSQLCDGVSRREVLRVGGLSVLGLSLPTLLRATDETRPATADRSFGRAKNVIYLWLAGGPPQHETFDPKPDAPLEIRGAFRSIATTVPGVHFCELLPRTARIAHKLAVIRSLYTNDNTHSSSGYTVLTGYKYLGNNARRVRASDRPYVGSLVKKFKPSEVLPALSTVWIPDVWRLNENVVPAGQTAGILGRLWNPDVFTGDPADPSYRIDGFEVDDLPPLRVRRRQSLLEQVERHFDAELRGEAVRGYGGYQEQALDLLTSAHARHAFDLTKEPAKVRERYGSTKWGQNLLLARRLIESGVRMVHVNWPREDGDNAADNPLWDTHAQNADRLEDVLCPKFDYSFTALIDDLDERGLLDETLVVAVGEFGRTPKINAKGGRDHWGPVFSCALAGAGIAGGQVYGASDRNGAYPASDPVVAGDLTATILYLLGVEPHRTYRDVEGREQVLTEGTPVHRLLGTQSGVRELVEPGGDVARVPPFDPSFLLKTDFSFPFTLRSFEGPSRPKGWRGSPLLEVENDDRFGVRLRESANPAPGTAGEVVIGFGTSGGASSLDIPHGAVAVLAQEVRSPFSGTYELTAEVAGDGVLGKDLEKVFLEHFTCKLSFFEFADVQKSPSGRKELASVSFQPRSSGGEGAPWQTVRLKKAFLPNKPGSNFSFGPGLGVAVTVEKTSEGTLVLDAAAGRQSAFIRVRRVGLDFVGKERNAEVTI